MLKFFDSFRQRLRDPLLTVLLLMVSFLLFVIGPMQAAGVVTGQYFGYFLGLVLLPAVFLYSRNLLVAAAISVAIALVVTAALLDVERSPRSELYLDSAAWLIAALALGFVVARAVFGPGRITYHRVVGAVLQQETGGRDARAVPALVEDNHTPEAAHHRQRRIPRQQAGARHRVEQHKCRSAGSGAGVHNVCAAAIGKLHDPAVWKATYWSRVGQLERRDWQRQPPGA